MCSRSQLQLNYVQSYSSSSNCIFPPPLLERCWFMLTYHSTDTCHPPVSFSSTSISPSERIKDWIESDPGQTRGGQDTILILIHSIIWVRWAQQHCSTPLFPFVHEVSNTSSLPATELVHSQCVYLNIQRQKCRFMYKHVHNELERH